MNIHAAWHEATNALNKTAHGDEAKLEVQLLLEHVLNVNHAWLIAHANDEIEATLYQQFQLLIQRRIAGEPIAYMLGQREFYGLTLKVSVDTLIPRPETETQVESALEKLPNNVAYHVFDLGTGSGAIALAIAKHRPLAKITAIDASESALTIAQENAKNLNITNVHFMFSDWFEALQNQTFNLIVSNPPYIEEDDPHLNQGDLRFEPRSALASGEDGLNAIRSIIKKATAHLKSDGWLMFEHGYNQAKDVSHLLISAGYTQVSHAYDLAGIQRVTLGQLPE